MIITMETNKIKEILAQTLGYEMREFNPSSISLEELEEKVKELGLNPQKILEDYEEEEKKKAEEEYNKYFGVDEEDEDEDYEDEDYY
jgi:signal recognition particle subunit SEC65